VITSVQCRRQRSQAEKEQQVAAAMEPGAVASEVAPAAGIHTSQLFRWRQQLCERTQIPAVFNPRGGTPEPAAVSRTSPEKAGVIEIEFASGGRMWISGSVDVASKYSLHLPLNRQSTVFAREGIDLDVSTFADWVGATAATLMPLVREIRGHVFVAERIHTDDTTVPVLAKGKTRTGRPVDICPRRPALCQSGASGGGVPAIVAVSIRSNIWQASPD
jgi:transposase-like protein